ncbi:MAG: transcription termination factor NusA [Syntrophales bacterium]|jgi:N utilization substance protein A|nr:transcription termination factor NusA [Syntrophales bacterium]MCK9527520.1 transcription termination factor NusA [Syntrophales bacterium]MDX9922577.1 transcription termination factor NusA [Syntrophales bacterium]
MGPDLKRLIDQLGKEKGLDRDIIVDALETAVLTAAKKKMGQDLELEAAYNEEIGEVEVFQFKTVVNEVIHPDMQVSLEEARAALDEGAELGDSLGMKIETNTFGRIGVQAAKQIIIQKVKDAERDIIYEEFKDRKGELANGSVQRFEGGNIIVNLGRAEGIIPTSEQIYRETFKRGERIRAYIVDVKHISKGPQIILSRTHPAFIKCLFELEVPEISEGFIEIVNVAREPGHRTKIAVRTKDRDIDPVGACVGMRGSRVQGVVQELRGEKIDIVPYADNPVSYVCSALSPAKVDRVFIDEEGRSIEVIVPDDQLSLAIGKNGQNVRLAARLTGWKIDVKSGSSVDAQREEAIKALQRIPGVDATTAEMLFNQGFKTIPMITSADPEVLGTALKVTRDKAASWIAQASRFDGADEEEEAEQEHEHIDAGARTVTEPEPEPDEDREEINKDAPAQ